MQRNQRSEEDEIKEPHNVKKQPQHLYTSLLDLHLIKPFELLLRSTRDMNSGSTDVKQRTTRQLGQLACWTNKLGIIINATTTRITYLKHLYWIFTGTVQIQMRSEMRWRLSKSILNWSIEQVLYLSLSPITVKETVLVRLSKDKTRKIYRDPQRN